MSPETSTLEERSLTAEPSRTSSEPPSAAGFHEAPDPARQLIGKVLKGQYLVKSVLGQGAMGLVFRGTQQGLDKSVAIKVMHLDGMHTKEWRDRFEREATVVSKILHPSITQVLDFGIEGNMPFLVMEFIDGEELTDVLAREGPMPPARAVAIVRQLASALEEAHRHGIVHRDIKPQNLRLMRYTPGGQIFLKVLDFGIAKQMGEAAGKGHLTATGAVMGTPMYMAPEQAGGHKVDVRADQYAVGIVLYELLTGTVPFTGETLTGVLVSHLTKPPPPLPRQVPEPLQKLVMRLLAKTPGERFADMGELDRALAACESACRDVLPLQLGRVQAHVAGGEMPAAAPSGRPLRVAVAAAGGGLALVFIVALLGPRLRDHKPGAGDATPPIAATKPGANTTGPAAVTADKTQVPPLPTATDSPTKPDKQDPPNSGTAKATSADSPAGKTEAGAGEGRKPHGKSPAGPPPAAFTTETPEIKERLNEAQKLLDSGDGIAALELAKRTQSDGRFARAYRIMTLGSCQNGNIGMARISFPNVAPRDRAKIVKFCRDHGKDLDE